MRAGGTGEALAHELVPATGRQRLFGAPAADIKPVRRAGHRDVEQPAVFLVAPALRIAARSRGERHRVLRAGDQPERQAAVDPLQRLHLIGCRGGIGQDHDWRLEPLGAVHGQHAHLAHALVEIALHLGLAGDQPMQEALERGRMVRLEGERRFQELVERILGLRTQPRQQPLPPAQRAQHLRSVSRAWR